MLILQAGFPTINFDTIDPRFIHLFTTIIAEPSSSGKSMLCMRLIINDREYIAPPPECIVYCYSVYQTLFDQYPNVLFVEGFSDVNMFDGVKRTLLIIDDLKHETNDSLEVSNPENGFRSYNLPRTYSTTINTTGQFLWTHITWCFFKNVSDGNRSTLYGSKNVPKNSEAMKQKYKDATGNLTAIHLWI